MTYMDRAELAVDDVIRTAECGGKARRSLEELVRYIQVRIDALPEYSDDDEDEVIFVESEAALKLDSILDD